MRIEHKDPEDGNTLKRKIDIEELVDGLYHKPEEKPVSEEEYLDAMNDWVNVDMYGMPRDKSGLY